MKNLLYPLLSALAVYLLFAFGNWDFVAGDWTADGRIYCIICMIIVFLVVLSMTQENSKEK